MADTKDGIEVQDVVNGSESVRLRERNKTLYAGVPDTAAAKETVVGLNSEEDHSEKSEKEKKTFGRTPDGTGTLPRVVFYRVMSDTDERSSLYGTANPRYGLPTAVALSAKKPLRYISAGHLRPPLPTTVQAT